MHRRYAERGLRRDLDQHLGHPGRHERRARLAGHAAGRLDATGAPGDRLARQATADAGRVGERGGGVQPPRRRRPTSRACERFELLARVFEEEPPDLVLLETMSLIRELTFAAVQALRRHAATRSGSASAAAATACAACSASTGAVPRATSSAAPPAASRRWASSRCSINCMPPDHVAGMLPWLRDFTDLPLGVYPNLGYYTESGWRFDRAIGGRGVRRARRSAGARRARSIIGGCCGVRPEHIERGARRARRHPARAQRPPRRRRLADAGAARAARRAARPWTRRSAAGACTRCDSPSSSVDPGVFVPTPGQLADLEAPVPRAGSAPASAASTSAAARGLLTVQLALNGAAHVHAIDIDERAVANTLTQRVPQRRRPIA